MLEQPGLIHLIYSISVIGTAAHASLPFRFTMSNNKPLSWPPTSVGYPHHPQGSYPLETEKTLPFRVSRTLLWDHRPTASWGGLYSDHPMPSTANFKKNTYPTKWG